MILPTFLSTCALALTANALLVPPHIETADLAIADKEFWDGAEPIMVSDSKKVIALECKSCPAAVGNTDGHPSKWIDGLKTALQIEFAVDGKQLMLNGLPIYPSTMQTIAQPLEVDQIYASDEDRTTEKLFDGHIPISTSIEIHQQVEMPISNAPLGVPGMRRISIEVVGLADKVIHVDTIEVRFIEAENEFSILSVSTTPYNKHSTPEGDACTTVFCRIRAIIAAKISAFRAAAAKKFTSLKKGCKGNMRKMGFGAHRPGKGMGGPGKPPHFAAGGRLKFSGDASMAPKFSGDASMAPSFKLHGGIPKFSGDATLAPGGKNHPHGPFPHGGPHRHGRHGHHGHHRGFRLGHFIRLVGHVMTPVLIGVAAGMAVSGIAVMIGNILAILYLRFQRRRRGGDHAYQTLDQTDIMLEKGGLDGPPMYEDVAVESVEVEESTDEKKDLS